MADAPTTPDGGPRSLTEKAGAAWQQRGGPLTVVRRAVCEVIGAQTLPFTAEGLLPQVRAVERGVSLASVYRTLGDLVEFGLLHESRGHGNEHCYTAVTAAAHGIAVTSAATVVCRDCGALHPLANSCLPMREGLLVKQAGFRARKLDLRIEADCETLRNSGHCDHRPARPAPPENPG